MRRLPHVGAHVEDDGPVVDRDPVAQVGVALEELMPDDLGLVRGRRLEHETVR